MIISDDLASNIISTFWADAASNKLVDLVRIFHFHFDLE